MKVQAEYRQNHLYRRTRRMVVMAMLVCLAAVLSYLERLIPISFGIPGLKLGLANIVVLLGIYFFPFRRALTLVILKCLMTAWIFGSFSAFLYSISGSLLSFFIMILSLYGTRHRLPITIVSIAGAVAHNLGQILMAALIVGSFKIFYYLPVLAAAGLLTGMLIGLCTRYILYYITSLRGER